MTEFKKIEIFIDTGSEPSGSAIADARLLAGLKQIDVANILGVTVQTVGKWESFKTEPRAVHIYMLSKVLCMKPDEIIKDFFLKSVYRKRFDKGIIKP